MKIYKLHITNPSTYYICIEFPTKIVKEKAKKGSFGKSKFLQGIKSIQLKDCENYIIEKISDLIGTTENNKNIFIITRNSVHANHIDICVFAESYSGEIEDIERQEILNRLLKIKTFI